jgi:hypothetical protein
MFPRISKSPSKAIPEKRLMKACADQDLSRIQEAFRALDPVGARTAGVLRNALDQIYDGPNTGRYRWDQLFKTEKMYFGNLVEIYLQREFRFEDGLVMRFRIEGIEANLCCSHIFDQWRIPPDARNQINILVSAFDGGASTWSLGVFRAMDEWMRADMGGGGELMPSDVGLSEIHWIWKDAVLAQNLLLQLHEDSVRAVMALPSCTDRVCELFRVVQTRVVRRAELATVARNSNFLRTIRRDGGARTALRKEGIIVLGQYDSHAKIAEALNLPIPGPGDSVSIRVFPAGGQGPGVAEILGSYWRGADPSDPVIAAPDLPSV